MEKEKFLLSVCEFLLGHYGASFDAASKDSELKPMLAQYVDDEMAFLECAHRAGVSDFGKRGRKLLAALKGSKTFKREQGKLHKMLKQKEKEK